ncbi:MAG: fimbrillin family protein [Phocaeicola sp.]
MKHILFSALCASAFVVSCSHTQAPSVENGKNELNVVEINLGSTAKVNSNVNSGNRQIVDKWDNTKVGIYALDNAPTAEDTEGWITNISGQSDNKPCIMQNVMGTIVAEGDASAITLSGGPYYYPRSSTRNYSFYAYYPEEVVRYGLTKDSLHVIGEFDGRKDILWGRTKKVDAGYNAAYFRKIVPAPKNPDIVFHHLTSLFHVNIKKGYDYTAQFCAIDTISMNLPSSYKMVVAALDPTTGTADEFQMGLLSVFGEVKPCYAYANDQEPIIVPDGEVSVKAGYLLVPSGETSYRMTLIGEGINTDVDIKLKDGEPFEPGKAYTINLTINGKMEIGMTATLTDWVIGEDVDIEV